MAVIHTAYTTMKMLGPKAIATIKADQPNALACENASLSHAGHFSDKAAQERAAKATKTKDGSTPTKPLASKPPIDNTLRARPASIRGQTIR
jgi:hypothetical protein